MLKIVVSLSGIFLSTTGNLSNKYNLEITPSGSTFSVWGLIYFWQAAWLIYALTLICRRNANGYLYVTPPVIPIIVYAIYISNLILNIAWLFTFDRESFVLSCIILFLIPITLFIMLFFCARAFTECAKELITSGAGCIDIWFARLFVHNGIAVYAGWTTVASLLNLGICLVYITGLSNSAGCSICLGVLTVELIVLFIIENFIFEKLFRYIFAQYFTLLAGTIGSYQQNFSTASQTNAIWIAILLSMVVVFFIFKVARSIYMHIKHPLYQDIVSVSPELSVVNSKEVIS